MHCPKEAFVRAKHLSVSKGCHFKVSPLALLQRTFKPCYLDTNIGPLCTVYRQEDTSKMDQNQNKQHLLELFQELPCILSCYCTHLRAKLQTPGLNSQQSELVRSSSQVLKTLIYCFL